MTITATDNLTGTYHPAATGARTLREAQDLHIGGDRVTCTIEADRTAYVFVGTRTVYSGALPADITSRDDVNPWARDIALAHADTDKAKAEQLREEARQEEAKAQESYENCDTDGFLSQWAAGRMAGLRYLEADLVEMGGKAEFAGLFDLDGNLVHAVRVDGKWGWSWKLLDDRGWTIGWFNESKARSEERRLAAHAAKGYYVGRVRVPAKAELVGNSAAPALVRRDDWNADAEIIDNGQ